MTKRRAAPKTAWPPLRSAETAFNSARAAPFPFEKPKAQRLFCVDSWTQALRFNGLQFKNF